MSKYSEALKILKEAIQKAKKYDDLVKSRYEDLGITRPNTEDIILYNQFRFDESLKRIEELEQENQEHKEHIEYLEGKIKLLEKSIEAFEEENEILKDGVKEIKKYVYHNTDTRIMITDIDEKYLKENDSFTKIKAMLEVVEENDL